MERVTQCLHTREQEIMSRSICHHCFCCLSQPPGKLGMGWGCIEPSCPQSVPMQTRWKRDEKCLLSQFWLQTSKYIQQHFFTPRILQVNNCMFWLSFSNSPERNNLGWRLNWCTQKSSALIFLGQYEVHSGILKYQPIKEGDRRDAGQSLNQEDSRSRKWQLTPVLSPGKFHGQRSWGGLQPTGSHGVGMTEWLSTHR